MINGYLIRSDIEIRVSSDEFIRIYDKKKKKNP